MFQKKIWKKFIIFLFINKKLRDLKTGHRDVRFGRLFWLFLTHWRRIPAAQAARINIC